MSEKHEYYMKRAIGLAKRGRKRVPPNPLVGAVVVKGGKIIAGGYHAYFGGPHAERAALKRAGSAARGATLYVTLEPCCHHGKTPPCTDAIIEAGIKKVVVAHRDPIDFVRGKGISQLKRAGIEVVEGVMREESALINLRYLKRARTGAPYVISKWAMSLDGKIAARTGDSRGISSERSLKYSHGLRAEVDAILVGVRTVIVDNPELTCRRVDGPSPARIVLDARCDLPLRSRLVRSARKIPLIVATTSAAPVSRREALTRRGAEVLVVRSRKKNRPDVTALLKALGERGCTSLLVEGGGEVHASFLESGLVDEVCVFVAPGIIGGQTATPAVGGTGANRVADALRLVETHTRRLGPDTLIRGRLRDLSYYLGR